MHVDAKTLSDYRRPMSNVTSQNDNSRRGNLSRLSRGLAFATLAALPLCGLTFFLETTRPAQFDSVGAVAAELSVTGAASLPGRRYAIARFKGVSAELRPICLSQPSAQVFSASDAERAFAGAPYASLKAGFQTEFVTKQNRRVALRIVSREAIVDRAVPDNARLMNIVPASTANAVTFVWGPWIYMAEVEDKGLEPEVVVQKVL